MNIKRTDAKQAITMLRVELQSRRANKTLEAELGYRCERSRSIELNLTFRLMGL